MPRGTTANDPNEAKMAQGSAFSLPTCYPRVSSRAIIASRRGQTKALPARAAVNLSAAHRRRCKTALAASSGSLAQEPRGDGNRYSFTTAVRYAPTCCFHWENWWGEVSAGAALTIEDFRGSHCLSRGRRLSLRNRRSVDIAHFPADHCELR